MVRECTGEECGQGGYVSVVWVWFTAVFETAAQQSPPIRRGGAARRAHQHNRAPRQKAPFAANSATGEPVSKQDPQSRAMQLRTSATLPLDTQYMSLGAGGPSGRQIHPLRSGVKSFWIST